MGAAGDAARAGALRRVPWALAAPLLLLLTVLIAPAFIRGDGGSPSLRRSHRRWHSVSNAAAACTLVMPHSTCPAACTLPLLAGAPWSHQWTLAQDYLGGLEAEARPLGGGAVPVPPAGARVHAASLGNEASWAGRLQVTCWIQLLRHAVV